ncbi:MAG: TIR domain-containing protein [Clostridia bacterium]|nr:TIR domain-containing protein [Clostridia bacterium]
MIRPYEGKEGYLFISYSHKDMDRVMPIVSRIHELGYNVWYDEGIDPGTEWADTIALHIEECSIFIAFLTESFIKSKNCLDELDYARDKGVKQILIYLEELELTRGLAMRTNRIQAFYKFRYPDEESFYARFNETDELKKLRKKNTENGTKPEPVRIEPVQQQRDFSQKTVRKEAVNGPSAEKRTPSGSGPNLKIIASAVGIVVIAGAAVAFFSRPKSDGGIPSATTAAVTASITEEPTEVPSPTPTVNPTNTPSPMPTEEPTATPSPTPTVKPTATPSPTPTVKPTATPSV